ncbi:MAG TPA: hypothetical protein VEZ47_09430, partial [Gemmatirosa sp.]|nr:hypothetical protein [Gemmatirosa sp.]
MTAWLAAAGLAALLGALSYAPPPRGVGTRALALAALRGLAALLLAALALDAPAGRASPAAPLRALDVSASTTRALGAVGAGGLAAPAGGDTLWLVGDSARVGGGGGGGPVDRASRVSPIVERAAALGRPLVLVTDGELDDGDALLRAPTGSRVVRP